jgi:hypothetical protein
VDQIQPGPAALQPVVFVGVPLHHLATRGFARSPWMHGLDLLLAPAPLPSLHHQLAQRFPAHVALEFVGQILARQCRSEAVINLLRKNPHGLLAQLRAQLAVRWPAVKSVHDRAVGGLFSFTSMRRTCRSVPPSSSAVRRWVISSSVLSSTRPIGRGPLGHEQGSGFRPASRDPSSGHFYLAQRGQVAATQESIELLTQWL